MDARELSICLRLLAGRSIRRVDDTTTPGYTYIGHALKEDALNSEACWYIYRTDSKGNAVPAGANFSFCQVWAQHASLTYSAEV